MYGYLKLKANVLQWKTYFGTIDEKKKVLRLSETPCTRCQRAIKIPGSVIQLEKTDTDFSLIDVQGTSSLFRATSPFACGMWLAFIKMMIQGIDPRELFVMTPKRVRFNFAYRSIPYSLKIKLTKVAELEATERSRVRDIEKQVFSDFWAEFREATFYRVRTEIRSQLVAMGFGEDSAAEAASQCSGRIERAIEILESPEQLANSEKMFHNKVAILIENFGYSGEEAEMALSITEGNIDEAISTLKEQGVEPRSFSSTYHSATPCDPTDMIQQLLVMGFSQEDAAMALNEADGDFKLAVHSLKNRTRLLPETHSNNLAKILAMGYTPEEAEDALGEAEGDLTNAVELLSSKTPQSMLSPKSARDDQIVKLSSLGFTKESADIALKAANGDFGAAAAILESQRRITSMENSQFRPAKAHTNLRQHLEPPSQQNSNSDMIKAAASGAAKKLIQLGGGVKDAVQKKLLPGGVASQEETPVPVPTTATTTTTTTTTAPTATATKAATTPTPTAAAPAESNVKDIDLSVSHSNPFSDTDDGADDLSEFLRPAGPEALVFSPIEDVQEDEKTFARDDEIVSKLDFGANITEHTKFGNSKCPPADQLCGIDDSTEEATPMESDHQLPFSPGVASIDSSLVADTAADVHTDPTVGTVTPREEQTVTKEQAPIELTGESPAEVAGKPSEAVVACNEEQVPEEVTEASLPEAEEQVPKEATEESPPAEVEPVKPSEEEVVSTEEQIPKEVTEESPSHPQAEADQTSEEVVTGAEELVPKEVTEESPAEAEADKPSEEEVACDEEQKESTTEKVIEPTTNEPEPVNSSTNNTSINEVEVAVKQDTECNEAEPPQEAASIDQPENAANGETGIDCTASSEAELPQETSEEPEKIAEIEQAVIPNDAEPSNGEAKVESEPEQDTADGKETTEKVTNLIDETTSNGES